MAGLAVVGPARAVDAGEWRTLKNDIGETIRDIHVADDTRAEVMKLPGLTSGSNAIIEFFDYNCPACRSVAPYMDALAGRYHLSFVNTPVLSYASEEAAKVEAAVRAVRGNGAARALQRRLMSLSGIVDGERALVVAEAMGMKRSALEKAAAEQATHIETAIRLADRVGLYATPSFIIGNAGFVGYPGPKTIVSIAESMRRCGRVSCVG